MMLEWRICYRTLEQIVGRDTGRELSAVLLSLFLKLGTTWAIFKSGGTHPLLRDIWKKKVKAGECSALPVP